jgi:hypothetical protein
LQGELSSAARAVAQSVEDAEIDARLHRGATLVRGECLPNKLGIRFRQRHGGAARRNACVSIVGPFSSMTPWELLAFSDILLSFLYLCRRE